jgi:pimeloyl-ACP methyl ester carboxylesterase
VSDTDQAWEPHATADAGYALYRKERRVVADDGTPIAYTFRNPDGPAVPVIFANGWSCSDAYWGKLLPELERRGHPCLLPDTRGHGRSGLPRDPGRGARNLTIDDVSMNRIGRDLIAVLDDAGVDRAVVMGHSMGVQTALEAYRQAPDRTLGLVLIAGTAENPAKTFYGQSIGDRLFPVGAAVMRWFPEILSPVWMTIGPAGVGHFGARLAKAAGPKTTAEDLHPYLLHLKSTDPAVMVLQEVDQHVVAQVSGVVKNARPRFSFGERSMNCCRRRGVEHEGVDADALAGAAQHLGSVASTVSCTGRVVEHRARRWR